MEDARTYRLLEAAKNGEQRARSALVEQHAPFVAWTVSRLPHAPLTREDALQHGHIGLIYAIERFDTRRGTKFTTFAHYCIKSEVRRGRIIESPLPSHVIRCLVKMQDAYEELLATLGREPSLAEIAARLGVQEKTVEGWTKFDERATAESLDAARPGCEDITLHDLLADPTAQAAFDRIDDLALVTDFRDNHANEKQRVLIDTMKDNLDMGQEKLAEKLNVNQTTVSRGQARIRKQVIDLHQHHKTSEGK
ncbi:sigma-70 family RNA polymerase sigma factor [Armatimonas sp.]|uniref:sigma-70 family RNA polymerase sigma factor n=1 Tax=Armatimonas sp. TaxID=1872638 RepID=UPI00375093E0